MPVNHVINMYPKAKVNPRCVGYVRPTLYQLIHINQFMLCVTLLVMEGLTNRQTNEVVFLDPTEFHPTILQFFDNSGLCA
jgi:hypothetical protein